MKTKLCSHEAMDRCAMMLNILERELYNHPGLNRSEKKGIKKAMKHLYNTYQNISARL